MVIKTILPMTVAAASAPTRRVCEKAIPVTSLPWSARVCENLSPVMRPEEALPLGTRAALTKQSWGPLLLDL